jgi:hypothetical protein
MTRVSVARFRRVLRDGTNFANVFVISCQTHRLERGDTLPSMETAPRLPM